jgi:hypothetical protein
LPGVVDLGGTAAVMNTGDFGPNQAAPVNAPVAVWLHAGCAWRRVTEQRRSAAEVIGRRRP